MSLAAQATDTVLRIPRYVAHTFRTPLLRNGHLLTLSSGLTGVVGLGYWAVTALRYDPASVGRNSAAISMMMLLAGIAQLDLSTAMVRFVPGAGAGTRRLVAWTYLTAGALAVLVSVGFVVLAPLVSPGVTYFDQPLAPAAFVVATIAYTLFVIQDGVLTGLRRTAWVPVENAAFSVAKVGFVVLLATALPEHGIFVSWLLPVVAAVVIVGGLLFGWAIPRHQQIARTGDHDTPAPREIARFVTTGYAGAVCSIASMTLMPILVIKALGASANAGFAVAWVIAYSLHLVNVNMGSSLVVETSAGRADLGRCCRQVLKHIARLLAPAVVVVVIAAPYLLGFLGPAYSAATGALRLLSLGALPHLLVVVAINSARVQRRMSLVFLVQATECVLVLGLGWVLLPRLGLNGVGIAWLLTQSATAGFLWLRRDLWLPVGDR
jgi:O-antigen/teichoic acid export membrane protein